MSAVDELLALRDLSEESAMKRLGEQGVRRTASYGAIKDATQITARGVGLQFFFDEEGLALVYVGEASFPKGLDEDALKEAAGKKPESLRSRQGKRGRLHVAAEQGFAWSSVDGEIGWVEVFRPMSFADFKEKIYVEPPRFKQ